MTTDPDRPDLDRPTPVTTADGPRTVQHTRAASTYVFLVVGALVTLALVVFIVQNLDASPAVSFFGWAYELPIGINMLISALAGAIVTGLAGSVRIVQLRRAAKRH